MLGFPVASRGACRVFHLLNMVMCVFADGARNGNGGAEAFQGGQVHYWPMVGIPQLSSPPLNSRVQVIGASMLVQCYNAIVLYHCLVYFQLIRRNRNILKHTCDTCLDVNAGFERYLVQGCD